MGVSVQRKSATLLDLWESWEPVHHGLPADRRNGSRIVVGERGLGHGEEVAKKRPEPWGKGGCGEHGEQLDDGRSSESVWHRKGAVQRFPVGKSFKFGVAEGVDEGAHWRVLRQLLDEFCPLWVAECGLPASLLQLLQEVLCRLLDLEILIIDLVGRLGRGLAELGDGGLLLLCEEGPLPVGARNTDDFLGVVLGDFLTHEVFPARKKGCVEQHRLWRVAACVAGEGRHGIKPQAGGELVPGKSKHLIANLSSTPSEVVVEQEVLVIGGKGGTTWNEK